MKKGMRLLSQNKIKIERIDLNIPKFNGILSGIKMIHLSDLHIFRYGSREERLVRLVNQEKPDLVVITGDLVSHYKNDFSGCIRTLRGLESKYGIFVVFGNAEHTMNPHQVLGDFGNALKDIQVNPLINQNVGIKLNGKNLYLVGVDDPFFQFDNFEEAIQGIPQGSPTLLLAHSPDILFPRADALVINLLDSPFKKDHFKEWGWMDQTHFGPENGDVYFQNDGNHTIRIQSRQDGVALDTILLNPYEEIDRILSDKKFPKIEELLKSQATGTTYPDLVIIPASGIDNARIHGKWKKKKDPYALFHSRLDDMPPKKNPIFQPLIHPKNYFEADFAAKKGTKYHVWIRMKAYKGSPYHDSVYLQFNDSIDINGADRYRIGKPAYSKDRMEEMDLILAGHTHGGQVKIPFYGPIATMTSLGKKYVSGLYSVGHSKLYVSRGYGFSVYPIRLFCPPEIAVFNFQ